MPCQKKIDEVRDRPVRDDVTARAVIRRAASTEAAKQHVIASADRSHRAARRVTLQKKITCPLCNRLVNEFNEGGEVHQAV